MKINIPVYEYKRILKTLNKVEFPEEPKYYFETGIRRSIRIIPVWTTWQIDQGKEKEEIWNYDVTIIRLNFECKIEKFTLSIGDIEKYEMLNEKDIKRSLIQSFMENWLDPRTKEQFDADLETAINKIKFV